MMEQPALKFYPIGIQTFSELRTKDYVYIDKTEYVYRMTHSAGKYMFLSRPRRFGKSLLVSTLHAYFEGRKDLFQGLAIEQLEKEWKQYPVLHFDMSTAKNMNREQLESELNVKLHKYEQIYAKEVEEQKPNQRLQGLIERAYRKTGQKVVVLIDEYDAPLLDVMHEDENLPVLRNVMRAFLSTIPCADNTHYEGHYQQVLYILFSLLGYYTDIEVRTPRGRVDVVMRTDYTLYIIELKLDKDADTALRQIDLKQYPERFVLCGLPMVKVGINFDKEKKTIGDWKIEPAVIE